MNTGWISIIVLYAWFLCGLIAVKMHQRNKHANKSLVFAFFFIGPFGLAWLYFVQYKDEILKFIKSRNVKPEDTEYLDVVIMNNSGKEMSVSHNTANAAVIDAVKKMLYDAITRRSSDIFIDPKDDASVVRFRVDGMIRIYDTLQSDQSSAAVSLIKVASGMDIAEKRRPQDGSFSVICNGISTSFRVATVGVYGGEKVTIRVIASENSHRDLADIGLTAEQLTLIRNSIKLPSGMILMCGPTGSGKTSTLYSMLGAIDYSMKNVISIEDPIERVVSNISQMEVNVKAGITFASLLRNCLRQNPDIICVGEIRDEETAEIAAHAAQTGHLIIATLHSNDNIGTIIRLTDLGIPLRSIASCLHLIISQRLVRILCPHCKKPLDTPLSADQKAFCQRYNIDPAVLYTAPGCSECDHTGFSGRKAVFEMLTMTHELRAIMESPESSISAIQEYIERSQGDNSILAITWYMLQKGEIPLDEFERVNINL
ncbi:MAG: type II/IV secretion system protein [Lentisphaeria bacterium]|nr:type II/IV secretion system protein [Lentisphaeria bacterium]